MRIGREEFPENLQDLSQTNRGKLASLAENYHYFSYGPFPTTGKPLTVEQNIRLAFWDTFLNLDEDSLENLHKQRLIPRH